MNNQYQSSNQPEGNTGDKMLNWIVILAALILYAKTANILAYFSPDILNDIIGFDVSFIYGLLTAALVEFLALLLHFDRRAKRSVSAQIVKWIALSISGLCQIFSGYVSTGNISQMSDTMKFIFQYAVPVIPLLIVTMIFTIGHLPDDEIRRPSIREVGLKNMLPNFKEIWNGKGAQHPVQTIQFEEQVEQPQLQNPAPLGEVSQDQNFTKGEGSR